MASTAPTPTGEVVDRTNAERPAARRCRSIRRNILGCSLRAIGVGFAPGNVWTQDFGRT